MKKADETTQSKLEAIMKHEPMDWAAFDRVLSEVDDINRYDELVEETLLTEMFHANSLWQDGSPMPEIARHFLKNGYDVKANAGRNGGAALSALCWSSYDRYVLDTAKVLLDAGAPVRYEEADEEPDDDGYGRESDDPMESISIKLSGAWSVDKDYVWANIMEAYYAIANAAEAGKDYNAIDCYLECIGKQLTGVSAVFSEGEASLRRDGEITMFSGPLVLWFGERPLVINKYIESVIDPVFVADHKDAICPADAHFERIIGSKLVRLQYVDGNTCFLDFDNEVRLLLTNIYVEGPDRLGLFEFFKAETAEIKQLKIESIWRRDPHAHSGEEEKSMVLVADNQPYLLFPVWGNWRENKKTDRIEIIPCSKAFLRDVDQQLRVQKPDAVHTFRTGGNLIALRFACGRENLYIKLSTYKRMEVALSEECVYPPKFETLTSLSLPRKRIAYKWVNLIDELRSTK